MQPHKTELARLALQSHAGPLSMRERRALILCDGLRDLKKLTALLGAQTPALIMHLFETGYLANHAPAISIAVAPAPIPSPAPQAPATTTRRSLVAAKLYVIGMLELQRHELAATHRLRLQACQDPDAIVAHLFAAMHCLQHTASSSLVQRIRERLAEVLPEPYLPALEKLGALMPESTAA